MTTTKTKSLFFVCILILVGLTGCVSEPTINEQARAGQAEQGVASKEFKHLVYIPMREYDPDKPGQNSVLALLADTDKWIDDHPEVEVKNVEMVNATRENKGSESEVVTPSGTLLLIERKPK